MIEYSAQVKNMCPITKGPHHGPAPIPEEGEWVKAYAGTTPTATPRSTTPWCAWPRISPCAMCW